MSIACEDRLFRNPCVPYKEYKRIIYEPGPVARIIMNRPKWHNPMSHAMWGEIEDAFDKAIDDEQCKVIVLSGAGKSFSSGDDVIGLSPEGAPCLVTDETPEELMKRFGSEKALWHAYNIEHDYYPLGFFPRFARCPKPTIAMVQGYCIYAGFIAASALDLIFASEDALFVSSGEGSSGAFYGLYDLGYRKTLETLYEHRFLTARECYEHHMVSRVYPDFATLERETLAFANRVAQRPLSALKRIKDEFVKTMEIRGFFASFEATRFPTWQLWRAWAEDGHPERYEGKGIARTPVALNNLKLKLVSQGEPVPELVEKAIARAAERDDKATWQRALTQDWRERERAQRAQAHAEQAVAPSGQKGD